MSGWDEGNVYYSDQRYLAVSEDGNGDGNPLNGSTNMDPVLARSRFAEFIRNFQGAPGAAGAGGNGTAGAAGAGATSGGDDALHTNALGGSDHVSTAFIYRDALLAARTRLRVKMEHMQQFDKDLAECLIERPSEYLEQLELAAADVLAASRHREDNGEEPERTPVQVLLYSDSQFGPSTMRNLTSENVTKLVRVSGIVIGASKAKAKATAICVRCKDCLGVMFCPCKPGFGGVQLPRTCHLANNVEPGAKPCSLDPWVVEPEKSQYIDQQTLKLQEAPESVPSGETPRSLTVAVDRALVQRISPGTRVTMVGIYSIFTSQDSKAGSKAASVAVRNPYLRCVGLEAESNASGYDETFSAEEEAEFRAFAQREDCLEQIFARVAPAIFGHDDVKRAVACLLFGGGRKSLPDASRLRGDVNVLLLGDPSTAKSQFLKFVERTAPVAVYTSGKGSSAAGLTASVIRDAQSGEFYLEGGAMVLADGGVVCIDEFDKMRPEDRVAIHEAMEQQTISIAKAGITTVLNARAAVLAAANPPSGRYDDLASASENIELQTTILSRFDLIFIVKDPRNYERDVQIASHVINVHKEAREAEAIDGTMDDAAMGMLSNESRRDPKQDFLKRYVTYARRNISPRLTARAADLLEGRYVQLRSRIRSRIARRDEDAPAVPITVRQLEALVRIAESLAKMQLRREVTEEHAIMAWELFHQSTMQAAEAGVHTAALSSEQREEVILAEEALRQRLAVGAARGERLLLDEMVRTGFDPRVAKRAMVSMIQRGELEHRGARKLVVRTSA